ncbi:hypothetical protein A8H35_30310 [Burkholderia thailandensis]|nr:hypothetical protein A8H31_00205 [Burkholderia thailandensis]AWY62242.1 hypothetical protein A8H35_30310 [Burkholderia thailandensis]AWY64283.1 hypothetical protein A8H36_02515 [Burkholderia thailandensis]NOK56841.1 hypothetical protein [Burkholderia thailandensis]PHH34079.1 hypothetical protein CRX59_25845 [Burkholderia thailandensis]
MRAAPAECDASQPRLGENTWTSATSRAARSHPHEGVVRQHDCMLNHSSRDWGANKQCCWRLQCIELLMIQMDAH